MAASKGANTYNRQNWEDSSFPILCETCLGPSPFVRMMKETYGKECKICNRPFTIFRWCPGPKARFKKTEVCQSCAKVKNVCQTCIFDLEYGLPVEVRDKALRLSQQLPRNDVNREYMHQQIEQMLELEGDITAPYGGHQLIGKALANTAAASGSSGTGGTDLLLKLARTAPYYRRNRPHICSFWVKGECRRGEECPYRHEKPTDPDDPLSDQNLRDRYYGNDDPVAAKLLSKYNSMPKLIPPEDQTITTLYIGGIPDDITEQDLRNHFYQFGELRSVSVHQKHRCAFIQFATRSAAEKAAERTYDRLILGGHRLTVNWGKSPAALAAASISAGSDAIDNLPPVPGLPLPPAIPPTNLLEKVTSNNMLGGFFMSPPPPPPPISSLSSEKRTNPVDSDSIPPPPPPVIGAQRFPGLAVHLAPVVAEPAPPGSVPLQTAPPPPPILRMRSAQGDGFLRIPPPPPPPIPVSVDGTKKTPVGSDLEKHKPKVSNDSPLSIHYPSQNPQRMGSVPHSQLTE